MCQVEEKQGHKGCLGRECRWLELGSTAIQSLERCYIGFDSWRRFIQHDNLLKTVYEQVKRAACQARKLLPEIAITRTKKRQGESVPESSHPGGISARRGHATQHLTFCFALEQVTDLELIAHNASVCWALFLLFFFFFVSLLI